MKTMTIAPHKYSVENLSQWIPQGYIQLEYDKTKQYDIILIPNQNNDGNKECIRLIITEEDNTVLLLQDEWGRSFPAARKELYSEIKALVHRQTSQEEIEGYLEDVVVDDRVRGMGSATHIIDDAHPSVFQEIVKRRKAIETYVRDITGQPTFCVYYENGGFYYQGYRVRVISKSAWLSPIQGVTIEDTNNRIIEGYSLVPGYLERLLKEAQEPVERLTFYGAEIDQRNMGLVINPGPSLIEHQE